MRSLNHLDLTATGNTTSISGEMSGESRFSLGHENSRDQEN
jgi:hypothetical protein